MKLFINKKIYHIKDDEINPDEINSYIVVLLEIFRRKSEEGYDGISYVLKANITDLVGIGAYCAISEVRGQYPILHTFNSDIIIPINYSTDHLIIFGQMSYLSGIESVKVYMADYDTSSQALKLSRFINYEYNCYYNNGRLCKLE